MINIAVIDDQQIVLSGIIELIHLNPDFRVTHTARNGQEALANIHFDGIDVIITDLRMPIMDGIEFIKALRASGSNTPILVLTTFSDKDLIIESIRAGCNGFLLKDIDVEKLHLAITQMYNGKSLIEPWTFDDINLAEFDVSPTTETLTEIEIQLLQLIAAGFNNREISTCVHLAEGTVKNYISRILEKTHSRDRTQAVVKALKWGVI